MVDEQFQVVKSGNFQKYYVPLYRHFAVIGILTDIFLEAFWLSFRSSESGQFTFGYWNDRLTLPLGLIISA